MGRLALPGRGGASLDVTDSVSSSDDADKLSSKLAANVRQPFNLRIIVGSLWSRIALALLTRFK